jgi:hypothetical protein
MIYWFGLYVGFFRCSYNHQIGCVTFCYVAKHMCSLLCDISCWLKMKYLKWNTGAEMKLYYMWQALSEKLFWSYEEPQVFNNNTKPERQISSFVSGQVQFSSSDASSQALEAGTGDRWQLRRELHTVEMLGNEQAGMESNIPEVLSSRMGRSIRQSIFG